MRPITHARHESALRKELGFWCRHDTRWLKDAQFGRFCRYIRPFLEAHPITPESRVLDVGCGPTCLARHIPDGEKWYLDPLLNDYRRAFGAAIPEGVLVSHALEDANLPEGHFDLVLAINTLDHFRDPWDALRLLRRTLKPDGVLLLSLYVRSSWLSALRNLQEALLVSTDRAHPHSFSGRRLERDLRRAGWDFSQPRVVDEDRDRQELLWTCRRTTE